MLKCDECLNVDDYVCFIIVGYSLLKLCDEYVK